MTPEQDWLRWRALLRDRPLPAALVDLDALEHNVDRLVEALGDRPVPIRVASKSVRHPGLLRRILDRGGPKMRGVMTWAPGECALLAAHGFTDLLLAYPVARPPEAGVLARLCADGVAARVAVDDAEQVRVLGEAARRLGTEIPVVLDLDVSLRLLGGRIHLGVRRSPVRTVGDALALARAVEREPGVRLAGLLAYEAQIAGVRDLNPGSRGLDPVRRWVKHTSAPRVLEARRVVVEALRGAGFELELVNGGGTGSVAFTAADPTVTEVAAGSGFLCPHLFDGAGGVALRPAALFALPVVRRSDPDHLTCAGGGYPASGAAGADRLPVVHLPQGLVPTDLEGFGEVQTPFRWTGPGPAPALGDPVLCRHAKAGELAERFDRYLLVRGGEVVADEPTYRGLGVSFG